MEQSDLKAKLKEAALDSAEAHLLLALEDIKKIGKILVEETSNPFDDMAYNGILMFEKELKKLIDKVDGKEG